MSKCERSEGSVKKGKGELAVKEFKVLVESQFPFPLDVYLVRFSILIPKASSTCSSSNRRSSRCFFFFFFLKVSSPKRSRYYHCHLSLLPLRVQICNNRDGLVARLRKKTHTRTRTNTRTRTIARTNTHASTLKSLILLKKN